jgi:hypothetical protein
MKKTYVSLVALLAIFALTGCSSENVESDDSGELKITASMDVTNSEVSTRAAVSSFSTTPIGIFVDDATADATDATLTTAYTPTANTTATVTTGSPGSGTITSAIYLNATSAKVYAYYTGASAVGDVPTLTTPTYASTVPVTILASDAFDATGQTDYMWSTPVSVSKSSTTAALVFNHALSKLVFSITPTNYAGTGNLTSISLSDGASSGYVFLTAPSGTASGYGMAVSNGTLTGLTNTKTLTYTGTGKTLTTGENAGATATTVSALVAPTSFSSATITLSITIDNKVYTATFPTTTVTAWAAANQYTYAITISGTALTISGVSITDWTNTNVTGTSDLQ